MAKRVVALMAVFGLVLSSVSVASAADPVDPAGNPTGGPSSTSEGSDSQVTVSSNQAHDTFQPGDVFVAVSDGKVQWRLPDGTLNAVLDTGEGGFTTGMAFDDRGHLFLTGFSTNKIYEFDITGELIGTFAALDGTTDCQPESIVFDAAGNMYVGQAGCSDDILKFAPDGAFLARYDVEVEDRGSDWIDLASDQCTVRYTSEGSLIKQYDVCDALQGPNWAGGLNTTYGLRILPGDRVVVANTVDVRLIDGFTATTVTTYDATGEDCWFALNLDPDATTVWSADFCTSNVYRFDIASADVVSSFNTDTASSTVFGLAVFGELGTSTVADCSTEDLSGAHGEVLPDAAAGERVTVRYDARLLTQAGFADDAFEIAEKVQERAEHALRHYGSAGVNGQPGLGFNLPDAVLIQIRCQPQFGPVPVDANGFVGEPGVIQLRLEFIRNQLAAAALNDFPPGGAWDAAGAAWKNLIDHEIFHTIQYEYEDLRLRFLGGDHTITESPAMLAQDLFAETDDLAPTTVLDAGDDEYLEVVRRFALDKPTIDVDDREDPAKYHAAGVFQYWAERYGPQDVADLEQRVAEFLKALIDAPGPETRAYRATLGYDYATGTSRLVDAVAPLRDYYLAHYGLRASNISAAENADYAILDTESGPAYEPLGRLPHFDLVLDTPHVSEQTTLPWQGDVIELDLPDGATHLGLTLDSSFTGLLGRGFVSAIVPVNPGEEFLIDPQLMFDGPRTFSSIPKRLPVIGRDRVAVVFVNGHDYAQEFKVTAEATAGAVAVQFVDPTGDDPHVIQSAGSAPILLEIVVTIDGEAVPGDLPRSAFEVLIDQQDATVSNVDFRDGVYHLTVWAPVTLGPGTYPMTLVLAAQNFDVPGGLVIEEATPAPTQVVRADSLGELGQGDTASADANLTPGAQTATFQIDWTGSDFDLTLTAPSGRIIREDSTDADVTVSETSTSVTIAVAAPEAGTWRLDVVGSDVPSPEPVDYTVTETGAPLYAELFVDDRAEAGLPLDLHFTLGELEGGVAGGEVVAEVTDPAGTVRRFPLRDDGGSGDTDAVDGVYGARAWATDLAGSYQIVVTATGVSAGGAVVERQASATVTLGPKVDTDGDGVADAAEPLFGLDPADPTDGAIDHDGEGLGLATELAAGSDPAAWDTDRGGESDRSELAAGRDPRASNDDAAVESVLIGAVPEDGSLITLDVRTTGGTGSVQVYRLEGTSRIDVGLHPGTGATITDGPLAAGEYSYLGVAVMTDGAESGPFVAGPVTAGDDVTDPDFRITLNGGNWEVTDTKVSVTFTDLTEAVAEMRLATSAAALADAAWVPFSGFTSISIPPELGQHFVFAQVRDAAGNTSRIGSSFVFLIDRTAPTSSAGPLDPLYSTEAIEVPYTAGDDLSGVASVELWWRYRPDEASAWGDWTLHSTATSSPVSFSFSSGEGIYEFYTIATDKAGNREATPDAADAATEFRRAQPAWAWGSNTFGQLGVKSSDSCMARAACSTSPLEVTDIGNVRELTSDGDAYHTLALKPDSTVWAWGYNRQGQLGDGTKQNRSRPVQVQGLTSAVDIAAGGQHSLAVRSDGTVWTWGANASGQLGDGTTSGSTTPVQVASLAGAVQVEGGRYHSLALLSDGTVWAWGSNTYGQLGDGTTTDRGTPVQVAGLSGVVAIAGGGRHSLALLGDGTVRAWGSNASGQLGDGTTTDRTTPVQVSGLSGVVTIAAGGFHSVALKSEASVWTWGNNEDGQLGDGTTTNRSLPVQVASLADGDGVAAGNVFTLAVLGDGSLYAWGSNDFGQLGDGTTTTRLTPVSVGGSLAATRVAAGSDHSLSMAKGP